MPQFSRSSARADLVLTNGRNNPADLLEVKVLYTIGGGEIAWQR